MVQAPPSPAGTGDLALVNAATFRSPSGLQGCSAPGLRDGCRLNLPIAAGGGRRRARARVLTCGEHTHGDKRDSYRHDDQRRGLEDLSAAGRHFGPCLCHASTPHKGWPAESRGTSSCAPPSRYAPRPLRPTPVVCVRRSLPPVPSTRNGQNQRCVSVVPLREQTADHVISTLRSRQRVSGEDGGTGRSSAAAILASRSLISPSRASRPPRTARRTAAGCSRPATR